MILAQKVGRQMRMIRESNNIKQNVLAKILAIQASLLSMYELGHREPPIKFLDNFCSHFNISLSRFFSLSESIPLQDFSSQLREILSVLQKLTLKIDKETVANAAPKKITKSTSR